MHLKKFERKLDPDINSETDAREIIIWYIQQCHSLCECVCLCVWGGVCGCVSVCSSEGESTTSTVSLKVLFNNVGVPHGLACLLSALNCFWPGLPSPPCTQTALADCSGFVLAAQVSAEISVLLGFNLVGASLSEKKYFVLCGCDNGKGKESSKS